MKVVGFGDFLMHLSPTEKMRFAQADTMRLSFTGAEANVLSALGLWGTPTDFVTRIPRHALSERGVSFLRGLSVGTEHIAYGEGRMGVYFLESGYSLRPSQVIYDRMGTAFTESSFGDYDWDAILADADIFCLSGITPALSDALFACTREVLAECKRRGILVVFDVNLRPAICDIVRSREIFSALSPYVGCLISNEEHLKQLLDVAVDKDPEDPERLPLLADIARARTGIERIAITVRRTPSASRAVVTAAYHDGRDFAVGTTRTIDVVDRVGSGDAFTAGLVYSIIKEKSALDAVEFAIASSAIKHTVYNDVNFATVREIETLVKSTSCDVRR